MIFLKKSSTAAGADLLDPALWTLAGWRTGRVTLTRPGGTGPLILAHDGVSAAAVMTGCMLTGVNMLNGLVHVEQVIRGWDFATNGDTVCAGAGGRLSGTAATGDWNAYFLAQRQQAAGNRRASPRQYVAGTSNNMQGSTETGAVPSLPATWADGVTHIITELEMAGDQITTRAKVATDGTWAHSNGPITNALVAATGGVGLFSFEIPLGTAIDIYDFQYTPA